MHFTIPLWTPCTLLTSLIYFFSFTKIHWHAIHRFLTVIHINMVIFMCFLFILFFFLFCCNTSGFFFFICFFPYFFFLCCNLFSFFHLHKPCSKHGTVLSFSNISYALLLRFFKLCSNTTFHYIYILLVSKYRLITFKIYKKEHIHN